MATETVQLRPADLLPGDEFFDAQQRKVRILSIRRGRVGYLASVEILSPSEITLDPAQEITVTREMCA